MLSACGKPVPAEKAAYAGEWQAPAMYLLITRDGSVSYRRLKGFVGDNLEVGIGPMATSFVVSQPPYQNGGEWKMVVDGVELSRQ